ncbi:MAG: hypothetical protein WC869_05350 [Phycisphaerae bacterium]
MRRQSVTSVPTPTEFTSYSKIVQVRVAIIELPLGTASGSEELWSYLDEEATAAVRTAGLGRNGFRVGVGRAADMNDLTKVFKRLTGRDVAFSVVTALPGQVTPVPVKRQEPEHTIFTFYGDRTVSGADYPPGDYMLNIACSINEDDPSRVVLTVMPNIRSTAMETRFASEDGQMGIRTTRETFNFEPVQFQVILPVKDLVIVGPGGEAQRSDSIAHHFLLKQRDGITFESVIVMIPEVLTVPIK